MKAQLGSLQVTIDDQNAIIQELEESVGELNQSWWQKLLNQFGPHTDSEITTESDAEDVPKWVEDLKNLPETPNHQLTPKAPSTPLPPIRF